jgi:hypothetical protein
MRILVLGFFIVFSLSSLAGESPREEFMSKLEQANFIDDVAKEIRRDLWINGYEDVSSNQYFVTKSLLDNHVKKDRQYESHLDSDEVSELYKCYYRTYCELYLVRVSSNYWGGYGEEAHFIALNTERKKYETFSHVIYAE